MLLCSEHCFPPKHTNIFRFVTKHERKFDKGPHHFSLKSIFLTCYNFFVRLIGKILCTRLPSIITFTLIAFSKVNLHSRCRNRLNSPPLSLKTHLMNSILTLSPVSWCNSLNTIAFQYTPQKHYGLLVKY